MNEEFDLKKEEDMLFCMEEISLESKGKKDNNNTKLRRKSSEIDGNLNRPSTYRHLR